jgi:hypothetical protein
MTEIATSRADCQRDPLTCAPTSPADRLRRLARDLERVGRGRWTTPESVLLERLAIAHEMRRLARELNP